MICVYIQHLHVCHTVQINIHDSCKSQCSACRSSTYLEWPSFFALVRIYVKAVHRLWHSVRRPTAQIPEEGYSNVFTY